MFCRSAHWFDIPYEASTKNVGFFSPKESQKVKLSETNNNNDNNNNNQKRDGEQIETGDESYQQKCKILSHTGEHFLLTTNVVFQINAIARTHETLHSRWKYFVLFDY